MEAKQYDNLIKELKIIRKLLAASLYANDISSENISKITGMDAADIRRLVSKRKGKGRRNAKKEE